MRVTILVLGIVLLFSVVVWVFGPRARIIEPPGAIPEITRTQLAQILNADQVMTSLKKGVQKEVIWAHEDQRKTEWSVVYLHGFSASRREISPVVETVAAKLGANAFFTRFRGHGTDTGEAMGQVGLYDWMQDAVEARAIGHLLGDKVILVGTSHGGLLASWVAMLEAPKGVDALALVSPNFEPMDKRTRLLTLPWGNPLIAWMMGSHRQFEARNSGHAYYWNTRYPFRALFPMAAQVEYITPRVASSLKNPTLMFFHPEDRTVDAPLIQSVFELIPSQYKKLIQVEGVADDRFHVLAGDILSPDSNEVVISGILQFIKGLP
jgi:esterase/lipase